MGESVQLAVDRFDLLDVLRQAGFGPFMLGSVLEDRHHLPPALGGDQRGGKHHGQPSAVGGKEPHVQLLYRAVPFEQAVRFGAAFDLRFQQLLKAARPGAEIVTGKLRGGLVGFDDRARFPGDYERVGHVLDYGVQVLLRYRGFGKAAYELVKVFGHFAEFVVRDHAY